MTTQLAAKTKDKERSEAVAKDLPDKVNGGAEVPVIDKNIRTPSKMQAEKERTSLSSNTDSRDVFVKLELDFNDFLAFSGRAVDTVEDAATHFRRAWEPVAKERLFNMPQREEGKKPRLLVLGTGWGGHALTKVIDHTKYDVVVVSPRNCFVFTPLLAASAVGTVDTASITESIKEANPKVTYVQGLVKHIDPARRCVKIDTLTSLSESGEATVEQVELDYSKMVYAVGSKTATFGVPGVRENCYFLKEVSDAIRLRRALLRRFDEAAFPGTDEARRRLLLSFVVIGSGPTGIEFSGELSDFLATDIPRLFPDLKKYVKLRVISSSNTILPMFEEVLQARGLDTLSKSGIEVLLNSPVKEVKKARLILANGEEIPFGLCFWAGGTEARPLTRALVDSIPGQAELEGAKRGQLTVDRWLRVKGVPDGSILAIGDAVKVEGQRYATTGQVAAQEGAYVARLLNRGYVLSEPAPTAPSIASSNSSARELAAEGQSPSAGAVNIFKGRSLVDQTVDWVRLRGDLQARPFHFLNLGVLAYLGSGAGLAQLSGGENTRILDAAGKAGFFLWRSTYAVKQVSIRNRVCVLIDWGKAKVFGRGFVSPGGYLTEEE